MNTSQHGATHYGRFARVLHWTMALLIVGMLFVGVAMVDSVAPWQPTAVQLHKWLGLSLLVLVVLRVLNRLRRPPPALPADLAPMQALAARGAHVALYLLMFAMPLVGWAMQGAAGTPVLLPGGGVLPALMGPDLEAYGVLRDLHSVLGYSLFALVLMHVGAGLYHGLIRRDGVLASMLRGEPRASVDEIETVVASAPLIPSAPLQVQAANGVLPGEADRSPNENAPPG